MVFRDALLQQVVFEEYPQQVRLPASANSRNDFYLSIPHIGNELVQIQISLNLHCSFLR